MNLESFLSNFWGSYHFVPLWYYSKVYRTFEVSVSETMAARGLVNGRGPRRRRGRDSAKRVVSDTDTSKVLLEKGHKKNRPLCAPMHVFGNLMCNDGFLEYIR